MNYAPYVAVLVRNELRTLRGYAVRNELSTLRGCARA